MTQRKIALFSPPKGGYEDTLEGLGLGFIALGHACAWNIGFPDHDWLARWVEQSGVDIVVEINHVLPSGIRWPRHVRHACWLQDYWAHGVDLTQDLGASDHIFFIIHPKAFGFRIPEGRPWSILYPGARPDTPAPTGQEHQCDFSLCGFIPPPLRGDYPVVVAADGRKIGIGEFIKHFPSALLSQAQFSLPAIRQTVHEICDRFDWKLLPAGKFCSALQLIDEVLVRAMDRAHVVSELLKVSTSLELYGREFWRAWPDFAPYYRGLLAPRALNPIFHSTRINVHNGALAMHFRVMDCLAAGGFMLINQTPLDQEICGIDHFLTPGVHYGRYTMETIGTVARGYLADPEARRVIAAEGRRAILAAHTWTHRAEQILADLDAGASQRSR